MISTRWLTLAALLFCACSSAAQSTADGQDPEEQDITSGKDALEGEACGAKKCENGLVCAKKADGSASVCKKAPSGACAGKILPACPRACNTDDHAGAACKGGDACGSAIGDSCKCAGGTFACTPHPPQGPHCNLVCLE